MLLISIWGNRSGRTQTLLYADISGVEVSGSGNNYTFSVTIESPDTGCDQYAEWWEVIPEEGDLIYRRILAHSHVGGPFTRSGGTVSCGFKALEMPADFALDIEDDEPQADDCLF